MAKSLHNLNNFSGGEVSPKLDARVDQPKYATWMRQCQNMIPFKSGGLTRRPGTQYIAQAKLANVPGPNGTYLHNYAVAIYPFVFSPNVTFELEVGNGYIRFYSQGQQISLVTANLPNWVTTQAYTAGQFVQFSGVAYYCLVSISGTPFPGNVTPDVDTTHWVQQNVLEVPTPYIADCGTAAPTYQGFNYAGIQSFDTDPYVLTLTQINDLVYFVHPLYPPYVLTRFSNTNWTFTQVPFLTPALLDQNATDTQIAASGTTGSVTLTTSAPTWLANTYYTLANSVSYTWSVAAGAAGSTANPMLSGSTYIISTSGTVNWTALGASAGTVGTQFVYNGVTATGSGGQCQAIYNCVTPNQSTSSFLGDVNAGYWQQYLNFNALHVGSTWQLAYLNPSSYLEVDGTAVNGSSQPTGFATWTDSGGGSGTCVSTSTHYSSTIQCIGQWEVHTYGVWAADISIQRSTDGGNTWQTIRTVQSRSDRNVDITGTAVQLGLYRFGLTIPASVPGGAVAINPGATYPRIVFEIVDAFLYGLVNITAVTNNFTATANVVTQLASTTPTEFWSEAAWSNYRGFPQAVASFQQRIIYGGSGYEPQRIWGTVTNDIQNFSLGDQTLATDSFAFDLNAPMRGPIQWLLGQTDLICGFSGAEWIINSGSTNNQGASSGAAIGPTNINAVEHSTWGTAELVQPIIVGDAVLYAQRQSTTLRQMMFSFYTAKYMSQDLTMLSEHLFSSGIVQMAFMTRWRRQSIIWTVTRAGTLCGMTYELDQEVFGWHRHVTGFGQTDLSGNVLTNDNGFESVCCNFGQGTAEDEVWVVANRNINGVQTRFIERMNPNVWEEAFTGAPMTPAPNLAQAFYVDCGSTITMPGSTTIGGLYYLNNRYVIGLADGNAFGPLQVVNGSVTLPASIPASVGTVNIGLPISYAGQPMRIDVDQRLGATQGLVKQVSDIYLRVWNANGGSVSNGTSLPANWISGTAYPIGTTVTSPASLQTFYCVVPTSGGALTLDPSANVYAWNSGAPTGNWVLTFTPSYMKPTPIPYPSNTNIPYVSPMFVTVPTDIRLLPMPMPSPGADPVVVVQGSDALPLTVLGIFYKYDLTGIP